MHRLLVRNNFSRQSGKEMQVETNGECQLPHGKKKQFGTTPQFYYSLNDFVHIYQIGRSPRRFPVEHIKLVKKTLANTLTSM